MPGVKGREQAAVEPLQVIAAPRRLRILELVWDRELSAGQIAAQFEVSWSAVSQHLRVLKDAGLVIDQAVGNRRIYRVDPDGLAALRDQLDRFWSQALESFKATVEETQEEQ